MISLATAAEAARQAAEEALLDQAIFPVNRKSMCNFWRVSMKRRSRMNGLRRTMRPFRRGNSANPIPFVALDGLAARSRAGASAGRTSVVPAISDQGKAFCQAAWFQSVPSRTDGTDGDAGGYSASAFVKMWSCANDANAAMKTKHE
jgi:hypothetical protein